MLLKAWDRVRPDGWTLKLVGPSENGHRGELERQVRRLELEKVVQFSGPVSDEEKWDVYRCADLFVLPTYSENFGIVVAEALAAGVPVIATTGAPWEDLEISDCGWWVEPTERALTTALKEAFALSPRERAAMGRRGRALVENHYSWQGVARRMIEAYQWTLDGGSRPEFIVEGTQPPSGMGSR
jgi:glycosyltransferase involved in cell wall biosynthesis